MAQLDWTHSARAIRDTPGADYSARGLHTMSCVEYYSPITVSLFLLALLG
jgi:hypothetical protein